MLSFFSNVKLPRLPTKNPSEVPTSDAKAVVIYTNIFSQPKSIYNPNIKYVIATNTISVCTIYEAIKPAA